MTTPHWNTGFLNVVSIALNKFDDLIQNTKNSKNLFKKVHRISLHTVIMLPLDFWGGAFWRDIRWTFLKRFFEFLVNWIRSSNLFKAMLITFKKPYYFSVVWSDIPFEFKEINSFLIFNIKRWKPYFKLLSKRAIILRIWGWNFGGGLLK